MRPGLSDSNSTTAARGFASGFGAGVLGAFLLLVLVVLTAAGCARAKQYGERRPVIKLPEPDKETKQGRPDLKLWDTVDEPWDIPLVFVPSSAPEWAKLDFWTMTPTVPAAMPVAALATPPFGLLAMRLADPAPVHVKIKVPLGLPAPAISPANRPTLAKWQLGRDLFFDKAHVPIVIHKDDVHYSCATCHNPDKGFTDPQKRLGERDTLSLINVAYQRHFFWDGRAASLEETAFGGDTADKSKSDEELAQQHIFYGFARKLRDSDYKERFRKVFGASPTPDTAAKALATYMRTILSGNSVFDRAEAKRAEEEAAKKQPVTLAKDHFAWALGLDTGGDRVNRVDRGYRLFIGKANCKVCHPPGVLFSDHDFHNVGLNIVVPHTMPAAMGRFTYAPAGQKENRLIGAFRTPSLRA